MEWKIEGERRLEPSVVIEVRWVFLNPEVIRVSVSLCRKPRIS